MKEEQPSELQVRAWRDIVYGRPTTDENWYFCKDHWMRPDAVQWLKEQVKQIKNENTAKEKQQT